MLCSVVIPLYNRRALIGRALDSVLAQTRSDFELIVVDDGSTDGGADVVRERAGGRARVVVQPNGGDCAARNRGVAEARGRWVAFLDSDDEWRPRFLEKALGAAESLPSASAVFTDLLSVADGAPWLAPSFTEPRLLDDYFAFAVAHRGRGMTSSSTVARKDALLGAGGFPPGIHRSGDLDTWLRLALTGAAACVPEVLAVYHNEVAGSSAMFPEPFFPEPVKTVRRLRAEGAVPARFESSLRRLENRYLVTYASDLVEYGARARARDVLWRECSWRHCPPGRFLKVLGRALGA